MVTRRKLGRGLLILLALATAITLFAVGFNARNGVVSLMILAGLWFVDRGTRSDLSLFVKRTGDAERGAQAEEDVGAVLNHLPANCRVLHDVVAGHGNIDHVVLRDDGVAFLIETKSHSGIVTPARAEQFLKQTHGNIYWLRDFLKETSGMEVWINAAVVFTNAEVRFKNPIRGVSFMPIGNLSQWITGAPGNPQIAKQLGPKLDSIIAALLNPKLRRPQ